LLLKKIENVLLQSLFINQCFVYGDSLQSSLVAIVVPDEEYGNEWASLKNINQSFDTLCKEEIFQQTIMQNINHISKKNGLFGFETVKAIHIHPRPFSVENGLLTPSFKIKRHQVLQYYRKEIDFLYGKIHPPKSML